jgi:hypothetical protein
MKTVDLVRSLTLRLRQHHAWHLQQTVPDPDYGYIPADEYGDSGLGENTVETLAEAEAFLRYSGRGLNLLEKGAVISVFITGWVYLLYREEALLPRLLGIGVESIAAQYWGGVEWTALVIGGLLLLRILLRALNGYVD